MTEPHPAGPSRPKLPTGLLGMLALLAAVEVTLARHGAHFPNLTALQYRFAGKAVREAAGCEVLCFGDSLIKHGVVPRVLEARLGRSAYNLAIGGGRPPAAYFLLRRALDAGARPSAILVDFKTSILEFGPQNDVRGLVDLLDWRECLDLARTARDAGFFAALATSKLLPSLKARHEIRADVFRALRGESDPLGPTIPARLRNWRVNAGAHPIPTNPGIMSVASFFDEPLYTNPYARFDRTNVAYLRRFLHLAESRGIPVFWVVPPINPRITARREELGLDARYNKFIRAAQRQYPGVVVLDGRHSGYEPSYFADATHLDRRGAGVFSDDLASILRRYAGPAGDLPRWVELPAFQPRPIDVPIEDEAESRLAVESPAASRRL